MMAPPSCMDLLDHENLLFSVLIFLDDVSRQRIMFVNKSIMERMTTEESYQWRLERLEKEHGVYFGGTTTCSKVTDDGRTTRPTVTSPPRGGGTAASGTTRTMRQLFLNQYQLRHMWSKKKSSTKQASAVALDTTFQTRISVRFKPQQQTGTPFKTTPTTSTLPLSQRLTLLRITYNLSSNQEALKLLGKLGGIGCFNTAKTSLNIPSLSSSSSFSSSSSSSDDDDDDDDDDNTTTPIDNNKKNIISQQSIMTTGIHTIDSINNRVVVVDKTTGLKEFPFDTVLASDAKQEETYQQIGHPAVRDVLCGYNATILMYGQTGSGKTHTMMGTSGSGGNSSSSNNNNKRGLLPRALEELFQAVQKRSQQQHSPTPIEYQITVSYVEIYGNEVTDLLNDGSKVFHNQAAAHRMVLEGYATRKVSTLADVMALVKQGNAVKKVASTAMNERSSRAHSLFLLNLQQTCGNNITKQSRLILGDLGGAEQLKKSQTSTIATTKEDWKERTREAIQINLGLLALKNCVDALNRQNDDDTAAKQKNTYVPYGASKLTMLLSAGLSPTNSRTNIVICASQDPQHATESIASLQFAQACRGIAASNNNNNNNGVRRCTDEELLRELLDDLDARIEACRESIRREERWVTQQELRPDGETGEMELYTVTQLTGAEQYNEELERLLRQRGELTGTPW